MVRPARTASCLCARRPLRFPACAVDVDLASGRMTVAGRNISAVVADAAVLAELLTPSALEVPRAPGPAAEASTSVPA